MRSYTEEEFGNLRPTLSRTERTFARVDLAAIRHNGQRARILLPGRKILSVLKADAYGHGISGVVPAYESFTDWYAVAAVEEGLAVRAQSEKPVLLFGPVPEDKMVPAAENRLTFTVGSAAYARKLSETMEASGLTAECHLKIDTGLNRSGIRWREDRDSLAEIWEVRHLPGLRYTGTYTHFACGEGQEPWELDFTAMQFGRFEAALAAMEAAGMDTGLRHCCSTGAGLVHPEYRLDMVRMGMLPLGMSYSDESVRDCGLIPAMTWVSFVAQIERVQPGEAISYGCTFHAEKPMVIGMVTCGYADGYHRYYSNKSSVLTGGREVRVLGRVAMDYMLIDLTDVPDPAVGMEVILLGSDGKNRISAQRLSEFGESVSGEVTCTISPRVPRIYTE